MRLSKSCSFIFGFAFDLFKSWHQPPVPHRCQYVAGGGGREPAGWASHGFSCGQQIPQVLNLPCQTTVDTKWSDRALVMTGPHPQGLRTPIEVECCRRGVNNLSDFLLDRVHDFFCFLSSLYFYQDDESKRRATPDGSTPGKSYMTHQMPMKPLRNQGAQAAA